jgi:hydrogenase maturation protease
MPRTLIAGFGNVLRGDDGFGVEVIRRLQDAGFSSQDVELLDVGTGGIRLAQELLGRYDRLIIVDAMSGSGPPGRVHVRRVESIEMVAEIDLHLAIPSRALALAKALGALPREVFLIGCEPAEVDELTTELSPPVQRAVVTALHHIRDLLAAGDQAGSITPAGNPDQQGADSLPNPADRVSSAITPGDDEDPVQAIQLRDEILQVMYWLRGEGLGQTVSEDELRRFLVVPAARLAGGLARLVADGYLEGPADDRAQYRLTPAGTREGGRRFRDEFTPYLGRESHNQCGDPACECQTSGEACTRVGQNSG